MSTANSNIRFEAEYNLFVRLVKLVQRNTVSVILTLLILFLTALGYLTLTFLQAEINRIGNVVAPDESKLVIQKIQSDVKINEILSELRQQTEADRAKTFQYHNSQRSLQGIPFLYISATHEVVRPGISSELQQLQRLPSVLFNDAMQRYFEDKSPCIKVAEVKETAAKQTLELQGITIACTYPILSEDDIVGVVTLNYNSNKDIDTKTILDKMKLASIRISDALELSEVI